MKSLFLATTAFALTAFLATPMFLMAQGDAKPTPEGEKGSEESGLTELTSLEQAVELLSRDLLKDMGQKNKSSAARAKASEILEKSVVGKPATLKVEAREWGPPPAGAKNSNDKLRIAAEHQRMSVGGTSFLCRVLVFLPANQISAVEKLRKGDKVNVKGRVTRLVFTDGPKGLALDCDVRGAEIVKN